MLGMPQCLKSWSLLYTYNLYTCTYIMWTYFTTLAYSSSWDILDAYADLLE